MTIKFGEKIEPKKEHLSKSPLPSLYKETYPKIKWNSGYYIEFPDCTKELLTEAAPTVTHDFTKNYSDAIQITMRYDNLVDTYTDTSQVASVTATNPNPPVKYTGIDFACAPIASGYDINTDKAEEEKSITKNQYQQLLGLSALAKNYYQKMDDIKTAMMEIVDENDDSYYCTDLIWSGGEDMTVDKLLEGLSISVEC